MSLKKRVYFHAFIEQIYFSLTTVVVVMLQRIKKSLNDYSLFSSGVRLFNLNQVALQFTTPVFNCFQISFTSTLI